MVRGAITHVEIPADDLDRARGFYAAVAGWEFGAMEGFDDYWLFRTGEGSGGAIGSRGQTAPQRLRIYIEIDALEDALAAATANGGRVTEPPTEVPGQGRYAVVEDPEGNEVGLWESVPA